MSARAVQAFSRAGFTRDPAWTVDIDDLARRLAAHGLPSFDAALVAEDDVGGYATSEGKLRHGVYAGLGRLDGSIRWAPRLLAHGAGEPLLPVRYEHGAGEPSVWIDEAGVLWLAMEEVPSVPAYDELRHYLEVLALGLLHTQPGKSHHVFGDVRDPSLAATLGLDPAPEATGKLVQAWIGPGTHLLISDTPGFKPGSLVVTGSARTAATAISALAARGAHVVWVGPPPARPPAGAPFLSVRTQSAGTPHDLAVFGSPAEPIIAMRRVGAPWPWG